MTISEGQRAVAEHREILMGQLLEHDAHFFPVDGGPVFICPKCNGREKDDQFCPGRIATLPEQVEQLCEMYGEHLHTICKGCGFVFRRKCADWASAGLVVEP